MAKIGVANLINIYKNYYASTEGNTQCFLHFIHMHYPDFEVSYYKGTINGYEMEFNKYSMRIIIGKFKIVFFKDSRNIYENIIVLQTGSGYSSFEKTIILVSEILKNNHGFLTDDDIDVIVFNAELESSRD